VHNPGSSRCIGTAPSSRCRSGSPTKRPEPIRKGPSSSVLPQFARGSRPVNWWVEDLVEPLEAGCSLEASPEQALRQDTCGLCWSN